MRRVVLVAAAFLAAIGVVVARARTAIATDEHAGHDEHAVTTGSADAQGQGGAIPASGANAAARIAASPRHGEWVAVKTGSGDSVMAWLVFPERSDKAPVVVVIHENTGLTTWVRGVADQLAAEGFIAIAPDLLTMRRKGNLTSDWTPDSGRAAIGSVTADEANRVIDAVAKHAMALPAALPSYGIVGFCWGGARSFLHATHAPSLGAAVVYYGSPPGGELMDAIRAPVLGLYGGNDARINASIPATDSTMKRLGKSYEYHIFEGAGHGFLRGQEASGGPNLEASKKAWPMTVAFFRSKLGQ